MSRKTIVRSLAAAAIAAVLVVPLVTYGQDGEEQGVQKQSLVALSTAFTFQGSLADGGSAANGAYDFNFFLYDSLAGGNQVGPVQTLGDVAVANGLFTVTLDFGDVFHGDQHWLEIQVRPGASAGAYTILSPRQVVAAVPNASFALEAASATGLQGVSIGPTAPTPGQILAFDGTDWGPATPGGGGFTLPFTGSAASTGALITITNTGTGAGSYAIHGKTDSGASNVYAVVGEVTDTSAGGNSTGVRGINKSTSGAGIGVYGSQDGSGYGVFGFTPSGDAVRGNAPAGNGVYGTSSSGNGGFFTSSTGSAIEVNGKISVSGTEPAAFVWTVTNASNDACNPDICTDIDHPSTNGYPNAILIVTHRYTTYNNSPIGVNYVGGKWRIFNEDQTTLMTVGKQFNVLVIHP